MPESVMLLKMGYILQKLSKGKRVDIREGKG